MQEVSQMTTFFGLEGTRALISDRERRLLQEAERERIAGRARRRPRPAKPAPAPSKPEVAWGPWLQGGEPLHVFSHAGSGLR
jgi:hypothetical protein